METLEETNGKASRSFAKSWLTNGKYRSWIREVPNNGNLFYCTACKKSFSCKSWNVRKHSESARHNLNFSKLSSAEHVKDSRKTFMPQWLEIEDFKPWLHNVIEDPYSAYCSVCNTTFACGLSQIQRHADSKFHIESCKRNSIDISKSDDFSSVDKEPPLSFDDRKRSAEIRFAALVAEHNISHRTAEVVLQFFQDMGKDPHVLEKMTLGRTKCSNIISNVLYPQETERLSTVLQNSKFSIFIDESSDSTNEKWMTFLVRYVAPETLDIRTELVELINLDAKDCSAEKIFNSFKHAMWKRKIPFGNIVALSCDNASVMTGKHSSFKTNLAKILGNRFFTLPCPCHSSALVVRAACSTIPEVCEELLQKVANFIYSSPKRSAIFREFQQAFLIPERKISKLCPTRWLSHFQSVTSLLENWDSIVYFLQELVVSEKSVSGEHLLSLMQNPEAKAYLYFLKYVLEFFNNFSLFFQARKTRIHLLQKTVLKLLNNITRNFLKPQLLEHMALAKLIDFSHCDNQIAIENINLGSDCDGFLRNLVEQGKSDIAQTVRQNCLKFYVSAANEIRNRLPIDDEFLSKLSVFDPRSALMESNRDTSFKSVLYIAQKFGGFDEEGLRKEWFQLHLDFANNDKIVDMDFDSFWKTILLTPKSNTLRYPCLCSLLSCIRSLPNSNADPERSFSILSDIKSKKRGRFSSTTVNSICVLKSSLKAKGETAQTMEIHDGHLFLMSSDNLYCSSVKKPTSKLRLHAVDD